MVKKNKHNADARGEVRIIGGDWGGRKIAFPDVDGLRPSTDRVRETVFNWLQFDLAGSHCLDACAGSGVLGFEALSRQAATVHFVEKEAVAVEMVRYNADKVGVSSENVRIYQADIVSFLKSKKNGITFDIVFVDPPFVANLHADIFNALLDSQSLSENALIYCEMPASEILSLPEKWSWYRQKKFKNVSFGLITV